MADLRFLAHFPFIDEAKVYAKEAKIQLTDENLRGGEERLRQAISDGKIRLLATGLSEELERHISYYAASRAILAAWANNYAKKRVAVAESKTASDYLKNSQDRTSNYFELLASSLKIKITPANASDVQGRKGVFLIPFSSYLLYTPRDIHFKLSNMELDNGNVKVTQHQAERILEEAIRKRLDESALPRMHEPSQQIKNAIMRLSAFLPKEKIEPSKIEKKDFPPCILKLIEHLNSSINVPHSGRLALAIYLIKAGLTDEQIDSVFSGAPDYNKETTIYQIQYIRKKAYSVPSCKTMDTYGICIALCRCNNPANYREALHSKFAALSMQAQKEAETNG